MKKESYLIFGRMPVQEYLRSGSERSSIEGVYITENFPHKTRREILASLQGIRLREITRKEMDSRFPEIHHQGIVIRLNTGKTPPGARGKAADWKELLDRHEGLILATDRLQDPQNLGSIIRSAEALGVRALFITGRGVTPGPTSDRVSAGASFHLETHVVSNLEVLLKEARERGYWVCVSSAPEDAPPDAGGVQLFTDDLSGLPPSEELILVIGNEGDGVKPLTLARADYRIAIPLRGRTTSLNAGVATGILIERILGRDPTLREEEE